MFKKILAFSLISFLLVKGALADDYGLGTTAVGAGLKTTGTIATKIGTILGAALSLVGIAFFGLMLYGGFLWMTARGDEKGATKAKGIITDAIIGLIVVSASFVITTFVFGAL